MDMFMDKLTQKLTAQEIIRANTAADTAELNRLKNQVAEYNECLKRLQKLINEGESRLSRNGGEPDGLKEQVAELLGNMDKAMVDQLCNMDKAIADQLSGMETKAADRLNGVEKTVTGRLDGVEKTVAGRLESVEQGVAKQLETMTQALDGMETKAADRLNGVETKVSGRLTDMETKVTGCLNGVEKTVSGRLESVEKTVSGRLESVEQGVTKQLETMTQALDGKLANMEMQTAVQFDDKLTERLNAIDENTHREGVKIYRNVQAVVLEESGKQSETAKDLAVSVDKVRSKLNLIFVISIAALFFSLIGAAMQILSLLNIITV